MACKQVLVLLKDRSRVVNFSDGLDELTFQIRKHFADVLPTMEEKIVLQIKDEEWGGAFVDILPRTPIPDKSHIRGFVLPSSATSSSPTSADEPMVSVQKVVLPRGNQVQLRLVPSSGQLSVNIPPDKDLEVVNLKEDTANSIENIKEMATIYKKQACRPLTNYQKHMNQAAGEICVKKPGMLRKQSALIEAARTKIIDEGFQFVKGHSRSKRSTTEDESDCKPKRLKLTKDVREKRMKDIEEDKSDIKERISFKEKKN